jgi:hypothetical protein
VHRVCPLTCWKPSCPPQKETIAKFDPPLAALAPDVDPPTAAGSGAVAAAAAVASQNATVETDWRERLHRTTSRLAASEPFMVITVRFRGVQELEVRRLFVPCSVTQQLHRARVPAPTGSCALYWNSGKARALQTHKKEGGKLLSLLTDKRSHVWRFVRGPLPQTELPRRRLDLPWKLLDVVT